MKTSIYALLISFSLLVIFSCSDTVTDEFNNVNPITGDSSNLITKIVSESLRDANENKTILVSYDANDRVSSISDGTIAEVFVYNNGNLSSIAEGAEVFNISELYNAPYDAFETGSVEQYDNNGNPIKIFFNEIEYDYNTGISNTVIYQAEISYDNTPNPYFFTLKAAGLIDVLDNVNLDFSINPQIPQIISARMLFPLNNIKRIVYKDNYSVVLYEITADYIYNTSNHPISATVTGTDFSDNQTSIYMLSYTYKD